MLNFTRTSLLLGTALCLIHSPAFAASYTYEQITNGNAASIYPMAINASGTVEGYYTDYVGVDHGFVYKNHQFTSFDDPNAVSLGSGTYTFGMNNKGAIVGWYRSNSGINSFLYENGTFTDIAVPGADYTQTVGINDSGLIVGAAEGGVAEEIFTYKNGKYTTIAETEDEYENLAINASGSAIYESDDPYNKSFLYIGGHAKTLPITDVSSDDAFGLNNSHVVVGGLTTKAGKNRSYIYYYHGGKVKTFDVPGWTTSTAISINNNNVVAGNVSKSNNQSAIYVYNGSSFSFVSVAKAMNQRAVQINDAGQILGAYTDSLGDSNAFIATPKL